MSLKNASESISQKKNRHIKYRSNPNIITAGLIVESSSIKDTVSKKVHSMKKVQDIYDE